MLQSGPHRRCARPALALVFASLASHAAPPEGCSAPGMLLERFIPADCEVCWRGGDTPSGTPLALDWIVPSPRGDDAPLAAAALPAAGVRAGTIAQIATTSRRHVLPSGAGLSLRVEQGPPFNGYIAAQVDVERDAARGGRPAPSGAVAYLALVEQVRAGEEGATVQRMLVRAVVGPLPLDPDRSEVAHLHAFRVPQGSRPARLIAVGWAEAPGGKVLAAARVEPEGCAPAR